MIRYENRCVDCAEEMGCMGESCRYLQVTVTECDECGETDVTLYTYDGLDLCPDCLIKALVQDGLAEPVDSRQ